MNVKDHFKSIRTNVSKGRIKDAIDKLLFLSNKSALLDDVIIQSARLSKLKKDFDRGILGYDEGTLTRNQITDAILDLANVLENEINKHEGIRDQIDLSVEEFIRKFGLDKSILKTHLAKSSRKKFLCLWIDDSPENDKIEMDILMTLDIQCKIAKNPYDAYRIMKEKIPSIIIINSLSRLRDNEDEGIEFCQFLMSDKKYNSIPVLLHSISLQRRLENKEKIKFSNNIKNNFSEMNTLIIKDLIEEVIINLWKIKRTATKQIVKRS